MKDLKSIRLNNNTIFPPATRLLPNFSQSMSSMRRSYDAYRILKCFTIILVNILFNVTTLHAEGSGAWGVTANRQANLFVPATSGTFSYQTRGFMMLASTTGSGAHPYDPEDRLYVWVKAGETVFYGFRTSTGTTTINFSWYYDNTSIGYFPTGTTGSARVLVASQDITQPAIGVVQGRPADAAAAANGPTQVTGSGYNAYSFTNSTGSDRAFWVEIGSNNIEFNFWDITVASGSSVSGYTRHNGRVYCKYWSVVNDLPSTAGSSNSGAFPSNYGFYIPIDNTYTAENDYYVKYANFGGSNSGYSVFFANPDGPRKDLTFDLNRRSKIETSANAHFPLFLNNPDLTVWPSAPLPVGKFEAVFSRRSGSSPPAGQAVFSVTVDNPSIVDIFIDLNNNGVYDGTDVLISHEYEAPGTYSINWNGKDRNGADVAAGTTIRFISSLLFYPVHYPIFDMEQSLGITIKHVRPLLSGTEPVNDKLYWDDTGITGTALTGSAPVPVSPKSVMVNVTGVVGPEHKWWANGDNGFSQNNTINTWTGAFNEEIVRQLVFNYSSDVDLAVEKTVDQVSPTVGQTVIFTIQAKNVHLPINNGSPVTATGVVVTDVVPAGYTVVEVEVSQGSWSGALGTWSIGTLADDATATMTIKATVNATGPYLNTATIQGNENDENQSNNADDAGWPGQLPVTLVRFEARAEGSLVGLSWQTIQEANASHFEVERSVDAKKWDKLSEIAAIGESREIVSYSVFDDRPRLGANYYRLKMVDQDGSFAYSRMVSVNLENSPSTLSVYPNPVSGVLYLKGVSLESVRQVSVTDINGHIVTHYSTIDESGLDLSRIASGMYLIQIANTDGLVTVKKFVVNR